jgi:putative endopeptidase
MKFILFICCCFISSFLLAQEPLVQVVTTPKKKEIANYGNKPDVLEANLDKSVKPSDNIFLYANGGWIKRNPIPATESSWGIGNLVIEENLLRLRTINEKAAKAANTDNPNRQKIGNFWRSAMDSAKANSLGVLPLQSILAEIEAIKDYNDMLRFIARLNRKGSGALFGTFVTQDAKNSELMTVYLWQGGLNLPERDYYVNTSAESKKIRAQYVTHVYNMLKLLNAKYTQQQAQKILALETELAKASKKIEELRDPYANYNKYAISDLKKLCSLANFELALKENGITQLDSVIVGQPGFFKALDKTLKKFTLNDWKTYLSWNVVHDFAPYLSQAIDKENFNFYSKTLSGAKEQKPRWKRVLRAEEAAFGEMLGQQFVKEFFNPTTKARYEKMVEDVKLVYAKRIKGLEWMSEATKAQALIKLQTMKKKVGYPEVWKDFSAMDIKDDSYVQNVMRANEWWYKYNLDKLGKPVNRDEWDMTPQTYNAYYNPSNNEIVLPAGIFTVPGYLDEELDDATVYGYAGASTIGHEITHGFDDEGRQFDEKGNLKNWWTDEDANAFKERANVMVKQFNNFMPIDTLRINGKATLGENIADLGGVILGLEAYKLTDEYQLNESRAGLTPLQRYFLGYALGWLGHQRPQNLKQQLKTDVHSPANYRVIGPFMSVDEFYEAFKIEEGSKMYVDPKSRVRIW